MQVARAAVPPPWTMGTQIPSTVQRDGGEADGETAKLAHHFGVALSLGSLFEAGGLGCSPLMLTVPNRDENREYDIPY